MKSVYEYRRENLRTAIDAKFAGNASRMAEKLEFQQPSLIYRYLNENPESAKPIGAKLARKIEKVAGKPQYWLDSSHQQQPDYNVEAGDMVRRVPLISWVEAGTWNDVIDNLQPGDAEEWIHTTERVGPRAYALKVVGDSMTSPRGDESFPEGTIIILDPDTESAPGDFVVVRQDMNSECTFKQLVRDAGRFYLRPLNPQYPTLELQPDAQICGVLIQSTRLHRRRR